MTQIFNLDQIKQVIEKTDIMPAIEKGFAYLSEGKVVVPPVGELIFDNPPGDAHIKYGYIKKDNYYVIKVASGFYQNTKLGISPSQGLMLLFNQKTGELCCILLDEGYLTNIRTAAAGAVVAKYMAPKHVNQIGVFGAGIQGRLQVKFLKNITNCKKIIVWGLHQDELDQYKVEMENDGYQVNTTNDPELIASNCNLIISATPAVKPLLKVNQIRKGTHITAIGADTPEKNELDVKILEKTDLVVADSLEQSKSRGEIFQAVKSKAITQSDVVELGQIILGTEYGRTSDDQITVADLTGVAVQDIQISKLVFEALTKEN